MSSLQVAQLVASAEASADAAVRDATMSRALAATHTVSARAKDGDGAAAALAQVLALMLTLAEDAIPVVPKGLPIAEICAELSNDVEFETIATEVLEGALAALETFNPDSAALEDAFSKLSVGACAERMVTPSVVTATFGKDSALQPDTVPTGARIGPKEVALIAATLGKLGPLVQLPMQSLLPLVVAGAVLKDAHQTWRTTNSQFSARERLKRNSVGMLNLVGGMVYVGTTFPLSSNASDWPTFLARPIINAASTVMTFGTWTKEHPTAATLLPIVQTYSDGYTKWDRLQNYKARVGLPLVTSTRTEWGPWVQYTFPIFGPPDNIDVVLSEWIEVLVEDNAKPSWSKPRGGPKYYESLIRMQELVVIVALVANLLARWDSISERLRVEGRYTLTEAAAFRQEMADLRAQLLAANRRTDGITFQKRINMVARKIVVDLAGSTSADHALLRNAMETLIEIREAIYDARANRARQKERDNEDRLKLVERDLNMDGRPPASSKLTQGQANSFLAELRTKEEELGAIDIGNSPPAFQAYVIRVTRKLLELATGLRADHDVLNDTMDKLIAMKNRVANGVVVDMPTERERLVQLERRLNEEPTIVVAAAYGGSVVDALFLKSP